MGAREASNVSRGVALVLALALVSALFAVLVTTASADTASPVVVIMMENHSFRATDPGVAGNTTRYIVGNADAPYINDTLIPSGTLYSDYDALGPVSLPNYLDVTSGGDWGCTTDSCPQDSYPQENLFDLLGKAGVPFRSYIEPMPHNCKSGVYASLEHNPEVFYSDIDAASGLSYGCPVTDLPLPSSWPNPLPGFTFVAPSNCHNMHGSGKTGACPSNQDALVTAGDTWLSQKIPPLLAMGATVVVAFDEGASLDLTGGGGHVPAIVVGPNVAADVTNDTPEDHFGLLAGLERHFGLSPLLAGAATATPIQLPDGPAPAAPTITAATPSEGSRGTAVQITGTDLGTTGSVRFGSTPAAFTIPSDAEIDTTVPPGANAGPITLTARGGSVSTPFTVDISGPTLVQHDGSPGVSAVPSVTLASPTSAGDLLVAALAWKTGASVAVPAGWTLLRSTKAVAIYAWANAPAQQTITFSLSVSTHWAMQVSEWTGVSSTDVSASATSGANSGTAASTGTTAVTAGPVELVVGAIGTLTYVSQSGPASGYATMNDVTDARAITLDTFCLVTSSAGPQGTSTTLSAATKWRGVVATFR